MYIKSCRTWYDRYGQQKSSGAFLMLLADKPGGELRAVVRHVRMEQVGQFMTGHAVVKGERVWVSGTYGHDGLPMDADKHPATWALAVKVPDELARFYWTDDSGHNSAGREGPSMRDWALANLKALRRRKAV